MLIQQAYEVMYRYAYNEPTDTQLRQTLRIEKTRVSSFALAEIAFLVSLCSFDSVVSYTACQCLRLLAQAERQPDASEASDINEDEVLKRHPIYEQLGDPKVSMIGGWIYAAAAQQDADVLQAEWDTRSESGSSCASSPRRLRSTSLSGRSSISVGAR